MMLSQHLYLNTHVREHAHSHPRANTALTVVFPGNLITNWLLLSGPFRLRPAVLESTGTHTAEVSLRLMIMNYAEGHILLVTSHLHSFPLDCLA